MRDITGPDLEQHLNRVGGALLVLTGTASEVVPDTAAGMATACTPTKAEPMHQAHLLCGAAPHCSEGSSSGRNMLSYEGKRQFSPRAGCELGRGSHFWHLMEAAQVVLDYD